MAKCIGCSTQGGLLSGVFRAAQRPTGAPGGLAAAWSPVEMVRLQPEPRSARRAAVPSAGCVRRAAADGQAAHGWPGQHRPIRTLAARRASLCRMTSPWPATAEHRPRVNRPPGARVLRRRCVPLCCQQAAAARRAPMARRDRTVAMRTSTRARVPFDRRCARPVRRRSLEPALVHCSPHPIGSRTTRAPPARRSPSRSPSPSPGPEPSQVRAAAHLDAQPREVR